MKAESAQWCPILAEWVSSSSHLSPIFLEGWCPQSLHLSGVLPCFGELFVGILSYNSWCLVPSTFRTILIPFPNSVLTSLILHLTFLCPHGLCHLFLLFWWGLRRSRNKNFFFSAYRILATSPNIIFWEQLFTLDCIGCLSILVCYCNWLCGILLYRQMITYYTHPQHWTIKVVSNISLW